MLLILLPLFFPLVHSRITTNYDCVIYNGTSYIYDPIAVGCKNVVSDEFCETAFQPATVDEGFPTALGDSQRPLLCYSLGTATPAPFYSDAKKAALMTCPKTCGYCCLIKEFNCLNKKNPRIPCETITESTCQQYSLRQIIAEDCPVSCGFCEMNGCVDLSLGCDSDGKRICYDPAMSNFVNVYCRWTCQRCHIPLK